jgi:hypothetical protein
MRRGGGAFFGAYLDIDIDDALGPRRAVSALASHLTKWSLLLSQRLSFPQHWHV